MSDKPIKSAHEEWCGKSARVSTPSGSFDLPLCPIHAVPTVDSKGRPNSHGLGACVTDQKHTPVEWRVGFDSPHISAACLDANPGWHAITAPAPPFVLGGVVAMVDRKEDAEFIVRAVNSHEELLAVLRDLREACAETYKIGRIPAEPFVRAGNVLAKAEGRE